jgi:hypothetical protein
MTSRTMAKIGLKRRNKYFYNVTRCKKSINADRVCPGETQPCEGNDKHTPAWSVLFLKGLSYRDLGRRNYNREE